MLNSTAKIRRPSLKWFSVKDCWPFPLQYLRYRDPFVGTMRRRKNKTELALLFCVHYHPFPLLDCRILEKYDWSVTYEGYWPHPQSKLSVLFHKALHIFQPPDVLVCSWVINKKKKAAFSFQWPFLYPHRQSGNNSLQGTLILGERL